MPVSINKAASLVMLLCFVFLLAPQAGGMHKFHVSVSQVEFNQKKQAEKKAAELSANGKSPHFVQKVKEVIEE